MFGRNAFLYDRPMLGHGRFEALPMDYQMGQDTPVVVTTPAPAPVIVTTPSAMATLGTVAVVGLVGFLAAELTGITHVLGLKKYMR